MSSTSRLFVHDSIYDKVLERVAAKAEAIHIGNPFEWTTQMGAINRRHIFRRSRATWRSASRRVHGLSPAANGPRARDSRKASGSNPLCSRTWSRTCASRGGDLRPDTLICGVDVDDVIGKANSVEYGLTAAVWTQDITQALRTAKRLQSGYIWINGVNSYGRAVPFGGYKNSGTGRERGLEELYSYSEEKSLQIFL